MTITGVQIGGRNGPWMRLGDRVRVKKTCKTGRIVDFNHNWQRGLKVGPNLVTIDYDRGGSSFDDEEELTIEDIEFDVLEQLATDA